MTKTYDALLIGGGHNGLVAAAYLARAGLKVLVLEQRAVLGGIASTAEVYPGFKFDSVAHSLGWLHPALERDLSLSRHGLEVVHADPTVFSPVPGDNRHLLLWPDPGRSAAAIQKFSEDDATKWPAFVALVGRLASLLEAIESATMPHMPAPSVAELLAMTEVGRQAQKLNGRERAEFLRFIPMPVFELLNDWFETDVLKGTLGAAGISGLLQGPRATGTALNFLHQQVGSPAGSFRACRLVRGGIGRLAEALAGAARGFGAELRTGARVERVLVEEGRAAGVALASGEEVRAKIVVSSADPRRTFFDLVDPLSFEPDFLRAARHLKMRGAAAKVNLVLGELPNFAGLTGSEAERRASLSGTISISPSLDYLERAYDAAKYRQISEQPYLECVIPSLADPSRAPEGRHVMSIWVQYAPYHLEGGWTDERREALGEAVVRTLAGYAPNLKSATLHRQVLTPVDLEQEYGLTEGNLNHGEMMLEHLFFMRPVPGWAQYRTPLEGLYLCGAGTHPGGGLTGRPGYNAAREIVAEARRTR